MRKKFLFFYIFFFLLGIFFILSSDFINLGSSKSMTLAGVIITIFSSISIWFEIYLKKHN